MYKFLWMRLPFFEGENEGGNEPPATAEETGTTEETPPAPAAGTEETSAISAGKQEGKQEPPAPVTAEQIAVPEGLQVSDEDMTAFLEVVNDPDLSAADRATKTVEMYQKARMAEVDAWITEQTSAKKHLIEESDIGGANWETNAALITSVIEEHCPNPDKFFQALTASGMGNNYELASLLLKLGKLTSEGKPVVGAPTSEQEVGLADKMYPNQGKV